MLALCHEYQKHVSDREGVMSGVTLDHFKHRLGRSVTRRSLPLSQLAHTWVVGGG